MNNISSLANDYVQLVLSVGQHHDAYVDAYYGPIEWQKDIKTIPLSELAVQAKRLFDEISLEPKSIRQELLSIQTHSVVSFIEQLMGKILPFNEESQALYDAVSPDLTEHDFDIILAELDNILPGEGNLNARLSNYNKEFEIPSDKLNEVFTVAIIESRRRTKKYIHLPENEDFAIEYVSNKVWSAYNWYKGNNYSLIQVNTDFPMFISRAIDLASHEGYPGHHVFNSLLEQHLVKEKDWVEFCIYPLYSPLSLLAEGSANYGIEVAFPKVERLAFEKATLFPLAGIDPNKAELYYRIQEIFQKLSYAGNMVAKRFLDGEIDEPTAIKLLMKYALSDEQRSTQRIGFIKQHRSYVINYNLGQDMVQAYIEKRCDPLNEADRWEVFTELLKHPLSASMMK